MKGLLSPKTIAVIGASRSKDKIGHSLVANIKGFKGKLYPVNPHAKSILGLKCYKSILDVPGKVDVVLIAIPAHGVPAAIQECVDKGIKNIIIITAGFSEAGNREDEEKILKIIKGKARVLGPNCLSGDSSILITNDNNIKYKQIGPLIDKLIAKYKKHVVNSYGTYVLDLKHHNKQLNIASYHKGKITKQKIAKVMKRNKGKALRITCEGGHSLTCSEDHPVLVKKKGKLTRINASDLKKNEMIPIARNMDFNKKAKLTHINLIKEFKKLDSDKRKRIRVKFKNKTYSFNDFVKSDYDIKDVKLYVKREQISLPASLEISEELCKLLGFFIADGNYKPDCLRIGYIKCTDSEKEIRRCINKVFDSNLVELSNCKDLKFGRGIGKILFKDVFKIGKGALNKSIPDFIFNSSEKNIVDFLNGLYSGDGCIFLYKNKMKATLTITSISKKLIDQTGYLFSILDIGPFYKQVRYIKDNYKIKGKPCKGKKQYILRADSAQAIKALHKKGFRFLVKNKNNILDKIVNRGYNFPSRETEQVYYRKIKSIEPLKENLELYDFEVENSHNFVANQIVTSNCFGIVNTHEEIDTTFALVSPLKGDVAFISQGGGVLATVAFYSVMYNFGFSYFVSLGNMLDLDFIDFIEFFNKDPKTRALILYIERLEDGKKFVEVAKKCTKPIIAIKAGRSEAGKRAALSHTGSIAGDYEVYKAAFKQCGVTMVDNITEAFNKARYYQELKGNKIVIVSNAGAPGTLGADYCDKQGLEVAKLPKDLKLDKLPKAWSHNNPMDIVGDADHNRFKYVFDEICRKKEFFDGAVVIVGQQKTINIFETAKEIVKFKKKVKKPLVVCWMTNADKSILEDEGIHCFFEPEEAIKSFVVKE